jgi:hypothetical protein
MPLPDQLLHTAGSRLELKLNKLGRTAVLVCHGQDTAKAAIEVNTVLREKYPDARQLFIASIIDLRSFPTMFHGMVKPELEKAYLKAAAKLPEGHDPLDYVVLIPDWDGSVTDQLEAEGSTREAVVVVADAKGEIKGTCRGKDLAQQTIKILDQLPN